MTIMAKNQDVLKITLQFNKKTVTLKALDEEALPTYQKIMDVFKNPVEFGDNTENQEKTEITDYA